MVQHFRGLVFIVLFISNKSIIGGNFMRRRRIERRIIGLLLLMTGVVVIAVITLPYKVWMVLLGCCMLYLGYKLFI